MESHDVPGLDDYSRDVVGGICHPSPDPESHQDINKLAKAAGVTRAQCEGLELGSRYAIIFFGLKVLDHHNRNRGGFVP